MVMLVAWLDLALVVVHGCWNLKYGTSAEMVDSGMAAAAHVDWKGCHI